MAQHATVLDIGSSKVACLIGGSSEDERFAIYGAGIAEYPGFRHGKMLDELALADAVAIVLNKAQNEAKHRIRKVVVGVPGPFTITTINTVERPVASGDGRIFETDVEKLIDESLKFDHPEGYSIIHSVPAQFKSDGSLRTELPIGSEAKVLSASVSHIFVDNEFVSLISKILESLDIKLELLVSQPLAISLFIVPADVRVAPVAVVDVGYWHTDISIIKGNAVLFYETLNVGGAHFTTDLVYGLNLPMSVCEPLKRRYVFGLDYSGVTDSARLVDGSVEEINQETVQFIIEERAKELCTLIKHIIHKSGVKIAENAPIYLTGGGLAMMRGSREFFQSEIRELISTDYPWTPRMGSLNYVSAYGVLDFALRSARTENQLQNPFIKAVINFFSK